MPHHPKVQHNPGQMVGYELSQSQILMPEYTLDRLRMFHIEDALDSGIKHIFADLHNHLKPDRRLPCPFSTCCRVAIAIATRYFTQRIARVVRKSADTINRDLRGLPCQIRIFWDILTIDLLLNNFMLQYNILLKYIR